MGGAATVEEPLLAIRRRSTFLASPFGRLLVPLACAAVVVLLALLVSGNFQPPAESTVTLKGVMASKGDFFDDKEVQRLLLKHHIRVEVTRRGSREVALEIINQKSERYDFAFPSGQPAADLIKRARTEQQKYNRTNKLFTSPIVLASYRPYAEALVGQNVATRQEPKNGDGLYYTLETAKFTELGETEKTWDQIGIGEQGITNGNRVLAQTSGVCRANSAATYLGLIAFVANGERAPQTEAEVRRLAERIQPLILGIGMPESDLFRAYVTPEGIGEGPIIVVYEHQFFEYQLRYRQLHGTPDTERVLLYPRQEFQTDPEYISLIPGGGDVLGNLLATDQELRARMLQLGYRLEDPAGTTGSRDMFAHLSAHGVPNPPPRKDVTRAHLPELDLLERLIVLAGRCRL